MQAHVDTIDQSPASDEHKQRIKAELLDFLDNRLMPEADDEWESDNGLMFGDDFTAKAAQLGYVRESSEVNERLDTTIDLARKGSRWLGKP